MRIGVFGHKGYLGQEFIRRGYRALDANILDYDAVEKEIRRVKPELVLHLAGKSDPDYCELHRKEASHVAVRGTYNVIENCAKMRTPAVYLSSSQVWGGGWWESLWNRHAEDSKRTMPVNAYGTQKVAAEAVVGWGNTPDWNHNKVIRTSVVFDRKRFEKDLNDLKAGIPLDAPRFIERSFIHMEDFVNLVDAYCRRFYHMPPVLHLAGSETVSYYEFWLEVCKQFGFDRKLVRGRSRERNALYAAKRPHYGGLDVSLSRRLGFRSFDYVGGIRRMKDE